ncbi:MAG: hypothetical protein IJJ15_05615 [Ruminococcus sp.]|nr:hypothetical protein [Ruminococcus sp.]
MGPLFVNEYTRTFETDHELYQYEFFKKPENLGCYIGCAIIIIGCVVWCLLGGPLYLLIVPVFIIAVLVGLIIRYFKTMNICKTRLDETTNGAGKTRIRMELTESELIYFNENTENKITIPVSQLKRGFVTKNYYMIMTDGKLVYTFQKGCFTVGKEEEFYSYCNNMLINNRLNQK